jgi:hypothetical protein
MEEYLDQLWNISFDAIREVQKEFNRNNRLVRTEADLQGLLLCTLYRNRIQYPSVSFEVHSELTWYEADEGRWFKRDISLFNPVNIENQGVNNRILHKGFRHRGPAYGIELKFIRCNDTHQTIQRKTWEDFERLINYSHRFYSTNKSFGFPKKFLILIGCAPEQDYEMVKQIFIGNLGRFENKVRSLELPWVNHIQSIIQPVFISVKKAVLLWD